MATEVLMPQLGESIVEGTVLAWLKAEGDTVEEFEALLEVETDKVVTEVPAPAAGRLLRIFVPAKETVKAGTLLAMIGEPGETVPQGKEPLDGKRVEPAAVEAHVVSPLPTAEVKAGNTKGLGFISPVVARVASEHGIDLAQVRGSGRGGRITKKDVLAYVESRGEKAAQGTAPWEEPAFGELFRPTEEVFGKVGAVPAAVASGTAMKPGTVVPLGHLRRSIAEHMVRSSQVSPHVTTVMEADFGRIVAHRKANKALYARDGVNLTFTAYLVAATAEALRIMPSVNSSWGEEGIILHPDVNVGVAVSLGERGLIVPVVKRAEQKSLRGIAAEVNDLAQRARADQLLPEEVRQGTFTITNHGVSGSLFATPIINQPQCAILGVGALQKRVVVIEDKSPAGDGGESVAIRPMVYLSLTFDHRILDGAVADQFLSTLISKLENWA